MKKTISGLMLLMLGCVLPSFAGDLTVDNLTVVKDARIIGNLQLGSVSGVFPTNGWALYYDFNTNTNPVPDMSGNGKTGTVSGATWVTNGITGGGYRFDGVDDYINAGRITALEGATNYTICLWVKLTNSSYNQMVFSYDPDNICGNNNTYRDAYLYWSTSAASLKYCPGTGSSEGSLAISLADLAWHHIVLVRTNNTVTAYENGAATATFAASYSATGASDYKFWLGHPMNVAAFAGIQDEVVIYNRALSAPSIMELYYSYGFQSSGGGQIIVPTITASNSISQTSASATNSFMGRVGVGTTNPDAGAMLDVAGNLKVQGTNVAGAITLGGQTRTNWPAGAETWAQYPASADVNAANRTVTVGNLIVNSNATFNGSINLVGTMPVDNTTTGMVLFYDFATNTVPVPDLSGYGHVGSISGATWTASGKTNGAYNFDATNDWIQTASTTYLSPTNQLTILAWIKLDTAISNTYPMIVTKNPSSGAATSQSGNYEFRVNNNGVLYFSSQYSTNASQSASGVARVDDLNWHMVGVTVDAASRTVRLYRDGLLDNTVIVANRPISYTNAEPVRVGRRKDGYYYDGLIDEVRIYNRALTSDEMAKLCAYYLQQKNMATLTADKFNQTGFLQTNVFMGVVAIGTNSTTNALSVIGTVSATRFYGNGNSLLNLNGGNIVNASISGSKLANLTVTSNQIANSTITTGKLHLASVDARYVNANGDTMTGMLQLPSDGLRVNSNQFVIVGGNVGIGTNNPSKKLSVIGDISVADPNGTNKVLLSKGTTGGAITVGSSSGVTKVGLYGNTLASYFLNGLGVGTANPNSSVSLHVVTKGGDHQWPIEVINTDGTYLYNFFVDNYGSASLWLSATSVVPGYAVCINAGGDSYFNGGSLGIGTNTPSAKLHVNGDIRVEGGISYVAPLGDIGMNVYTNKP